MRPDDFFVKPKPEKPRHTILFAGHNVTHFLNECFVLVDGVESLPHAKEAEQLTQETALWAYKMVRQRPFYWKEKLPFLKRIFRSTNLRLWQKRRDPGYEEGLASALMVCIVIKNYYWLGSAGNINSFLFRDGLIDVLTKRDVEGELTITKAVGFSRKQLIPSMHSEKLLEGDILIMATDSVMDFVKEDELRIACEKIGTTKQDIKEAVDTIIATAKKNGSRDTMSMCIIKHIVL